MKKYIDSEKLISELTTDNMLSHFDSVEDAIENRFKRAIERIISNFHAADAVEVVRCKDCKHRIVNEHFGEKGYMKLKAMCKLDTGDPFELGKSAEDDNWFCADGERKDGDEE